MSHPLTERILQGAVPEAAKHAAAKGALPIPREDLIELWVCLRNDADAEVRMACKESLGEVEESEWLDLLPDYDFRQEVFEFAFRVLGRNKRILEAGLRNRGVSNASIKYVASSAKGSSLDMILDNQERLIRAPELVVAMLNNPALEKSQVRRIFDLAEQFFRENAEILSLLESKFSMRVGAAGGVFKEREEQPPLPTEIQPEAAEEEPPETSPEQEPGEEEFPEELLSEEPMEEEGVKTLYQQILTMPVSKKIELALKGNREARSLLIKDSNKTVQEAVLNSSRITEREVENITRMRSIPEDTLRKIARKQSWMKVYSIKKGIATNPKSPLTVALHQVVFLTDFDLRMMMRDRNISEVIRREAKKVFTKRHERKNLFKK